MASRLKRASRSARRTLAVALLVVLALATWAAYAAFAASPPAAPSISVGPASPTNSLSASFTYTDSQVVTKFQCSLDISASASFTDCGTTRPSSKSYTVAAGAHTFYVRAVAASGTSSATSYGWTVDTTPPPAPAIATGPSNPTDSRNPSFGFTATEAGETFLCSLDGSAFAACANPVSYSGVAIGSHAFLVKGKDAAGNVSTSASSYSWQVVPPAPSITAKPADPTNQTSASFSLTDSLAGVTFVCSLDGSSFSACSSPKSYPGPLSAATHTFQVKAASGANLSSATSYSWTVDLTAPTVSSIVRADPSPTNAAAVHWTVTFSKPVTGVATSNFQLVSSGFSGTPAVSGVSGFGTVWTVTANTDGAIPTNAASEQLKLATAGSIKDSAGNSLAGTPVSGATYTVDKLAPTVLGINRAGSSPTNAASVSWTVVFSEPISGLATSNFALAASGLSGTPAITGLSGSGANYLVTASTGTGSPGNGTLQLRLTTAGTVKDGVGNALAGLPFKGQTYTIDKLAPPPPSITQRPAPVTQSTSATFRFVDDGDNDGDLGDGDADDAIGISYVCSLDGAVFTACTPPVTYAGLAQGSHSFQVKALDQAGNISGTTTYNWFVDSVAPTTPVFTQKPADPTVISGTTTNVTFAWSSTDPAPGSGVAGYVCRLDGGTPFICTSPRTFSVGLGSHTFQVVAYDYAANFSGTASYTWTVTQTVSAQPYTISGNAQGTLYPTTAATGAPINLTFNNPNAGNGGSGVNGVQIAGLTVAIASVSAPNANVAHPCGPVDFAVTQFSGSYPFYIPQGTSSLQSLGFASTTWPSVRLIDRPVNQDGCKGATVNLTYQGHS